MIHDLYSARRPAHLKPGGLALSLAFSRGDSFGTLRKCKAVESAKTMKTHLLPDVPVVAARFKCFEMTRSSISVTWFHVTTATSAAPLQIGKYLVSSSGLDSIFGCLTQLCVVDDFGNLVGVPV